MASSNVDQNTTMRLRKFRMSGINGEDDIEVIGVLHQSKHTTGHYKFGLRRDVSALPPLDGNEPPLEIVPGYRTRKDGPVDDNLLRRYGTRNELLARLYKDSDDFDCGRVGGYNGEYFADEDLSSTYLERAECREENTGVVEETRCEEHSEVADLEIRGVVQE